MTDLAADCLLELREALQQLAPEDQSDWLHAPKNLAVAVSIGAAELLQPFQWLTNSESVTLSSLAHARVAEAMADVLLYLILFADKLDVDLAVGVRKKLAIGFKNVLEKEDR